MSNNSSRREFLRKTASTAVGALILPQIVPASALGLNGKTPPSDRIVMGAIGVGSQGKSNMRGFLGKKELQIVAVCDVDKNNNASTKEMVDKQYGNTDCRTYADFREFLEKEKLDVVSLALPDHWHAIISVDCANKKLDIYGEKPLARSIRESQAIVSAVKKNNIIWQTGSWQRSLENFRRGAELVINGRIGKISHVEVGLPDGRKSIGTPPVMPVPEGLDWEFWLGPALRVPYRGICHWNWRWIQDYSGGQLTDWAGHHIDIAHWGMGLDRSGPVSVEGTGVFPREGIYDVAVEYDFECVYANGIKMRVANASRLKRGMGTVWYGDKGWIHVDRGNVLTASDPSILNEIISTSEIQIYKSTDHQQNFIDCIRSRKETITPAEIAHRSISVGLLGEIAMITNQKIQWDPEKEEIIGNEYASRLLTRPYRQPWTLPVI
jgi:predicted dehydrogenase